MSNTYEVSRLLTPWSISIDTYRVKIAFGGLLFPAFMGHKQIIEYKQITNKKVLGRKFAHS